jgi:uncharacterized protein YdhG (YjbR/CyaY superfamily)
MSKTTTVDEYITSFPDDTQKLLEKIRRVLHEAIPNAEEKISYGVPTLRADDRNVVYFSGWKDHLAIYPRPHTPSGQLETQLEPYVTGKGTLRFALDQPVPYDLIKEVALALHRERREQ